MQLLLQRKGEGEGTLLPPGAVQGAGNRQGKAQSQGVKAPGRRSLASPALESSAAIGRGDWDVLPWKMGQARCSRELLGRAQSLSSVHTHCHLFSFLLDLKMLIK